MRDRESTETAQGGAAWRFLGESGRFDLYGCEDDDCDESYLAESEADKPPGYKS